jgi:glutathione S-transferase
MLTLYYKPACFFCLKVLTEAVALGIELQRKDVTAGDKNAEELLKRGGKLQTPCLIDEENSTVVYESDAIVAYLQKRMGADGSVRVHKAAGTSNVCV